MILKTIYRFRVLIEDNEHPFDFYLHIIVQHSEPPRYHDLVERIKHHSKNHIKTEDYKMTIQKDYCSYEFKNDEEFQEILKYFTDQTILEVKLFPKTKQQLKNSIPVIKPIFSRPTIKTNFRKDSGIFLPDGPGDLDRHKLANSPNDPLKLPAISPLLYNDRLVSPMTKHDTNTKELASPYPLTPLSPINPTVSPSNFNPNFIKLPALSSVVPSPSSPQVVPPIHPAIRSYFDKPAESVDFSKGKKRARANISQPPQFICEYVVDPSTEKLCCQTFQRSYDLSRHQNIHLKNRPFCVCHQCGKKFTRLDALRRHERIQGHSSKYDKQKLYKSQPV